MGYTIRSEFTLETEACCECGIIFAMPDYMMKRFKELGGRFYCPNGHSQFYTETEVQRLRKKLDEQTHMATQMANRARDAEFAEQKSQKEMGRMKKRASAGVCPCCNRTFQQLAKHMKMKHPKYGA